MLDKELTPACVIFQGYEKIPLNVEISDQLMNIELNYLYL